MSAADVVKINKLPSCTWNWLHMNETITAPFEIKGGAGLTRNVPENISYEIKKQEDMGFISGISTGLGDEMDEQLSDKGLLVHCLGINEGVIADEPAKLHFTFNEDSFANVFIDAEDNSEITVIMDFSGGGLGRNGIRTFVKTGRKSTVRLIQIQMLENKVEFYNDIGGECGENSSFQLVQLVLGGGDTYMGCKTTLFQDGGSFKSDLGYYVRGQKRLDMNYIAQHTGKKTLSEMNASGALRDGAFKLFRGTIDFKNGCDGAKGAESEDVLLLSEDIINQTIPLILCQEENVEGSHGASIGELDEDVLFYLKSRGIDEENAYEIMTRAKLDHVTSLIHDEDTRAMIEKYLES